MIWIELERDVTHPTSRVGVPLAEKGHTLCNVANDR